MITFSKTQSTHTIPIVLLFLAWIMLNLLIFSPSGNCETVIMNDQDDFFEETSPDLETDLLNDKESKSNALNIIRGSVEFKAGYNFAHEKPGPGQTDHRGLSALSGKLDLMISKDLSKTFDMVLTGTWLYNHAYRLNTKEYYTSHFLDRYKKEAELNKAFIRGNLTDNLDIKFGRQIAVFGKSDSIRITDILNPINALEIGMTDIKDLRLPVFMSRLDYYIKDWAVSSYVIHEHRGNRLPVFGSDFYYSPFPEPETASISMNVKNTGFAMSMSKVLPSMDIALYFARVYDNTPYLDIKNRNGFIQPCFGYSKINMAGIALNKAKGNFLFKAETACINGLHLSAYQSNGAWMKNNNSYSRLDVLFGFEYSGFSNTNISFEASDRWYHNLDKAGRAAGVKANNYQYALRVSRTFMNEALELSVLTSYFGVSVKDGGFFRFNAEYDITDSVKFTAGIIFYKSGDAVMVRKIGNNDRIFCSIKYSF
ncbi:MAG: hypothetical protein KAR45_12050 [Desulfobacteraceae bacterium]|nr:hypothetical protein [Desulfobacteraceae bacterium]